jgi:hypothetical protein
LFNAILIKILQLHQCPNKFLLNLKPPQIALFYQ